MKKLTVINIPIFSTTFMIILLLILLLPFNLTILQYISLSIMGGLFGGYLSSIVTSMSYLYVQRKIDLNEHNKNIENSINKINVSLNDLIKILNKKL